jgi:hypothetical protein
MKSGVSLFTRIVLGLALTMSLWSTTNAQDQNAMMKPPPPMTDSTILNWVGTWNGDLTMGDQKVFGEAQFSVGVGQQWIQGNFSVWTDKTKANSIPAGFVMYLRPGATADTYKAISVAADGSWGSATVTKTGDNLNWSWAYDNGMKETGSLTKMGPDHVVYKSIIADGSGKKIMDLMHDMHRVKAK